MSDKTELQRAILTTAYQNATQAEIADACDCSRSYVSEVPRRYDGQDAMEAQIEDWTRALGLDTSAGLATGWEQDMQLDGATFDTTPVRPDSPAPEVGIDDAIAEGVRGLTVLLPWTDAADEDMDVGDAVAAVVVLAVGIVGYALYVGFVAWAIALLRGLRAIDNNDSVERDHSNRRKRTSSRTFTSWGAYDRTICVSAIVTS